MESITQLQSIIYFILTGCAIVTLTVLSPIYGTSSIMIDLGLVAIYGKPSWLFKNLIIHTNTFLQVVTLCFRPKAWPPY